MPPKPYSFNPQQRDRINYQTQQQQRYNDYQKGKDTAYANMAFYTDGFGDQAFDDDAYDQQRDQEEEQANQNP